VLGGRQGISTVLVLQDRSECFFTTRDGRIGIGPPQVQKGDTVVLLYGGVTPFVLRRRSVFDVLVGDAYVYGAMKGELVEINGQTERVGREWAVEGGVFSARLILSVCNFGV
jgi:hypothetical protein